MLQGRILRHWTDRFLRAAGIAPGMSVLDLGSGMGDVSLNVADIVGPQGRVLGLDRDPVPVSKARQRVAVEGCDDTVEFQVTALEDFNTAERFDAIVGRYILLYQPDPAAILRRYAQFLRPGGVVVFHEVGLRSANPTWPPCPSWDDAYALIADAFDEAGIPPDFGRRLGPTFHAAGLPWPTIEVIEPTGGGPGSYIYKWMAHSLLTLAPRLTGMGRKLPDGWGFDETLAGNMRDAVLATGSQLHGPIQFGAWTRAP
jgi:SAM-dependent methyltransferase